MLGWEYPPHISGGLGTACEGLSQALAQEGVNINFVVPHLYGDEQAGHMKLQSCSGDLSPKYIFSDSPTGHGSMSLTRVPSFLSPYMTEESYKDELSRAALSGLVNMEGRGATGGMHYGQDIFLEVERYLGAIEEIVERNDFDVIHAHDWMTYPAAVAWYSMCTAWNMIALGRIGILALRQLNVMAWRMRTELLPSASIPQPL